MELIARRCPQCMGEVEVANDGMHAKCVYCGATYLLPKDQRTKPKDTNGGIDGSFDVGPVIDRFCDRYGQIEGVCRGDELERREALARKGLKVGKKAGRVRLAFDASPSGRFGKGLAITDTGVTIMDDDGDRTKLAWDELPDYDYAYRRGYLVVAGARVSTPHGEPIAELINDIMEELYGVRSPEPDVEHILAEGLAGREGESDRVVWGEGVQALEDTARDSFEIDPDEDVFLILDATASGSCKKGLAFCSSGIFMRDDEKDTGYAAWRSFDTWNYTYDGSVLDIERYLFTTDAGNLMVDALSTMVAGLFGVSRDDLPKGSDFPSPEGSEDGGTDVAGIAESIARGVGGLFRNRKR